MFLTVTVAIVETPSYSIMKPLCNHTGVLSSPDKVVHVYLMLTPEKASLG